MIESMACGTPVIAMSNGSVPEVVSDGVSGYVCDSLRDFIECVVAAANIDRQACRAYAESRFSPRAVATGYEAVYEELLRGGTVQTASVTG
jgi:glycosyltransferase involved in cell wall biosynthesis